MSHFKLLAIRPLKGCHKRFVKNLNPGTIYPIYNSYSFLDSSGASISETSGKDVAFIKDNTTFPNSFYNQSSEGEKSLQISISAIAGKNGAGKSTLIELLFSCIYLHCVKLDILKPSLPSISSAIEDLEDEKRRFRIREMDISKTERDLQRWITNENTLKDSKFFSNLENRISSLSISKRELHERKSFVTDELKANKLRMSDILAFTKDLKAEIYFELNGNFNRLKLDGNSEPFSYIKNADNPNVKTKPFDVDNLSRHFFYTIAVNHSHYALNSHHVGDWITSLFHKNDGYTAPIVINPMRTEGNFNINSEMNFARYRLLANKLREWNITNNNERVFVSDDKFINRVIFKLNRDKVDAIPNYISFNKNKLMGSLREQNLITTFLADYLNLREQKNLLKVDFALKDVICNYIIHKIDNIPVKYPWFGKGYQFSEETPFVLNEKFFKDLHDDGSHITYKLKQAIHFLKYCLSGEDIQMFAVSKSQLQGKYGVTFTYTLDEIFKWSNVSARSNILTTLPPSIFDFDFELSDKNFNLSKFTHLSSGEQQIIHTLQSVIYHLNNLQSAHFGRGKRSKYSAINIIYDEIELYFHPEYQRRFVDRLLRELKGFYQREQTSINSINILLLTHSPFILSDLPKENILLLEPSIKNGRAVPKISASQTFAANINDLLADGFFITGTLMGEFAESKIKEAISRIKSNMMTSDDANLLKNVGDSFLKASLDNFKNRKHD